MTRHRARTAALVALVLAGAWLLAACGQSSGDAAPTSSSTATPNSADVEFTQMMIVHHQGALDMAALAADRAGSQDVKDLATRIEAAQQPEIDTMTGWLAAWGEKPLDAGGAMPGMNHGDMSMGGDAGMASENDLTGLQDATGTDFDQLFLSLMITHHQGAVAMARREVEGGRSPETVAFAKQVVTDQSREIDEMTTLLATYGGS